MSTKGTDWDLIPPQLTYGWALALCHAHGWTSHNSKVTAVAVMCSESQRYTRAWHINRDEVTGKELSLDQGLWQINDAAHPYVGNVWNPWENMAIARDIYISRGHKFTAWAAYNSGAYLKYVPFVEAAWLLGRWKNKATHADQWDMPDFPGPAIPTP